MLRGRLDERRILVTGAGSGIGRALAVEASKRGALLCLCGRRPEALQETYRLLDASRRHLMIRCDLTDEADRFRLASHIGASWGALDMLVNNAGVIAAGSLETTDPERIREIIAINVTAPILLTRELMPLLTMGHCPRIVNLGSMLGEIPFANFAAYSASKSAIKGFSIAMRRELIAKGVGVTYAAPRSTATEGASRLPKGTVKGTVDSPEKVASQILNAVQVPRDYVYPSSLERLFMVLQAIAPRMIDRAVTPVTSGVTLGKPPVEDKTTKEVSHAQF